MLTLPDFKKKKIVVVGNEGSVTSNLKFYNSNIRLYYGDKFIDQVSCYSVICLFIIGDSTITTKLIKKAKEFGISIFFLSINLKNYAEIFSSADGNYKLRQRQYGLKNEQSLELSKFIVKNKIKNQQGLLKKLKRSMDFESFDLSISKANDRSILLGIEGNASNIYFKSLFEKYDWLRRAPQTKEDPINLLLDVGYTMVFNFIDTILHLFGFDTYKGFYHQLFFERRSLTCDMMEPIRPFIDHNIIKIMNLKQYNPKDFSFKNGSYFFKDYKTSTKYTNIILESILKRKEAFYIYVHAFYKHIQDPDKYKLIEFKEI